jgi:hypothetical protein
VDSRVRITVWICAIGNLHEDVCVGWQTISEETIGIKTQMTLCLLCDLGEHQVSSTLSLILSTSVQLSAYLDDMVYASACFLSQERPPRCYPLSHHRHRNAPPAGWSLTHQEPGNRGSQFFSLENVSMLNKMPVSNIQLAGSVHIAELLRLIGQPH